MASLRSVCEPVWRRGRLASLRIARAHHEFGRGAAAGDARSALRMGRLRRAGDHRPLGANGRAVDAEAARAPVVGAERSGAHAGARLEIPLKELNAQAPTRKHDAHVLALGVEADQVLPEGEFAPLEEVVAWISDNRG